MRKLPAALTVLAMAALGTVVPASAAHAAPPCQAVFDDIAVSGYMYAYNSVNCVGQLGIAAESDNDWGDNQFSFRGTDTNRASSILNKGRLREVQFFNGTGPFPNGGYTCLSRNEGFASDLSDNDFTTGHSADDAISSHRWVDDCNRWAD